MSKVSFKLVMSWNPFDSKTNKKEVAVTIAAYSIGGLVSLSFLDYGALALGLKTAATLPSEVTAFSVMVGTTLLGYLIGKKDNVESS